jgi:hypothetical protein
LSPQERMWMRKTGASSHSSPSAHPHLLPPLLTFCVADGAKLL